MVQLFVVRRPYCMQEVGKLARAVGYQPTTSQVMGYESHVVTTIGRRRIALFVLCIDYAQTKTKFFVSGYTSREESLED